MPSPSSMFTPLSLLATVITVANGLRLPMEAHVGSGLSRRAPNSITPITNFKNIHYMVNVTLGGQAYPVQIDTGRFDLPSSADLWIYGDVPNAKDTGVLSNVTYAVGTVTGSVLQAPMSFGGYDVPAQDFIHVTDVSSFGVDIRQLGYTGLIGLGPPISSNVFLSVNDFSAVPPMNSIFRQNMTSQNYITILLSRDGDPASPASGQLTISEPIQGHESILQQPRLPVVVETYDQFLQGNAQLWTGMTDRDGIIGPDGKPITVSSDIPIASGAGNGRLVTVFDTGYSLPQVPKAVADAIYAKVPGSYFNATLENGLWTLPCTAETNITFTFGGQKIFVHPLDVSLSDTPGDVLEPVNGTTMCLGGFQPIQSPAPSYDMILGMGFLRNAYILFDYGNFALESSQDQVAPYIQLLSVTNPNDAHTDFVNVRINKSTTTGATGTSAGVGSTATSNTNNNSNGKSNAALERFGTVYSGCWLMVVAIGVSGVVSLF
ncbi:hypothetical protein FRB94_007962 [Tulasnella sp. JGI-2019a]|nr:hypothetical protein FRB94_007962 [Tulasnella sp. JGI-2019a]